MEQLGLVGLPNSGKSTLFNALTGASTPVAAHPFSTTESTVGIAQVPDGRLTALAELSQSRKVVHAGVRFVDVAGLVAGSATGEGLGNRFLAGIREADAICLVLRAFEDEEAPGESDPLGALGVLELELVLADAATVESQLQKRGKAAKADRSLVPEMQAHQGALDVLMAGIPIYRSDLGGGQRGLLGGSLFFSHNKGLRGLLMAGIPIYRSDLGGEQRSLLGSSFLLTNKKVLAVINLGEAQLGESEELVKAVAADLGSGGEVLAASVKLEAEAAQLDPSERTELLAGLGLGEGALVRVARAAYHLLGRRP